MRNYDNKHNHISIICERKDAVMKETKEYGEQYVADWTMGKGLPLKGFYFEDGNVFVAVDNTDGNCWVEEFENEQDAIHYVNYGI